MLSSKKQNLIEKDKQDETAKINLNLVENKEFQFYKSVFKKLNTKQKNIENKILGNQNLKYRLEERKKSLFDISKQPSEKDFFKRKINFPEMTKKENMTIILDKLNNLDGVNKWKLKNAIYAKEKSLNLLMQGMVLRPDPTPCNSPN